MKIEDSKKLQFLIGTDELRTCYGIYSSAIDPYTKASQLKEKLKIEDDEPDLNNTHFSEDNYFNTRLSGVNEGEREHFRQKVLCGHKIVARNLKGANTHEITLLSEEEAAIRNDYVRGKNKRAKIVKGGGSP